MVYDVARVRGLYPFLADGWTHLDARADPQVPEVVIRAHSAALRVGRRRRRRGGAHVPSTLPMVTAGGGRVAPAPAQVPGGPADEIVAHARRSFAALLGVPVRRVAIGQPLTLRHALAAGLHRRMIPEARVILTPLGATRDETPWAHLALSYGSEPERCPVDVVDGSLRVDAVEDLLDHGPGGNGTGLHRTGRSVHEFTSAVGPLRGGRAVRSDRTERGGPEERDGAGRHFAPDAAVQSTGTRRWAGVFVLSAADPFCGTISEVKRIAEVARAAGLFVVVDASVLTAHEFVRFDDFAADVVLLSAEPLGGPDLGAAVFADDSVAVDLALASRTGVVPSRGEHDAVPEAGAEFFEPVPVSHALAAGVTAAVEHLADLDETAAGDLTRRLRQSLWQLGIHQATLIDRLVEALHVLPGVVVAGNPPARVPRLSFALEHVDTGVVVRRLADYGVLVGHTLPGESVVLDSLGFDMAGGAITVCPGPYTTSVEIDQLLRCVASFV